MTSRPPLGFSPQLGPSSRPSRRLPNLPTSQLLVGGAVLAILIVLFVIGSTGGTEQAEGTSEERIDLESIVVPALTRVGYGDVQVEADARTVTLSGELPTRFDVIAADAVVNSIAEVGFVVNNLSHPGQTELDELVGSDSEVAVDSPIGANIGVSTDLLILQARIASAASRNPISFQTGSAELTPESSAAIGAVSQLLIDNPTIRLEIGGHTDSDGVPEENEILSQARADAVVAALSATGIEPERLVAVGYGDTIPVASNETGEGKAQNRRIEFLLLV